MMDVDTLSSHNWPSIIEALQLKNTVETEDIFRKDIESLEKWEPLSSTFSKRMSFSIRTDDIKQKGDIITMRRWYAQKKVFEEINSSTCLTQNKKPPKPITRTGCQAVFRVIRNRDTDTWRAKKFVRTHNHETASVQEMQFLCSNYDVPDDVAVQIMSMNKVGIKTFKIVAHVL
ncbi:FHY3/FAR1 family [Parasponia andersonii]|uniref:FHY3/FAR1 family n=1 Tax=Parasponia andersonii TaxID=3476 RepID=A0A2P5B4Q7_PARAD|nr:FHY3/FAR1 family [Parasponia andersonii]